MRNLFEKQEEAQLITLQQAPIITYDKIQEVSTKVQQRIADLNLDNQIVTEQSVSSVKKTRAELNKEFKAFEEQRKLIKEAVAKPYQEFDKQYKEFISQHYEQADVILKEKIYTFENQIKKDKEDELKSYFEELCQSKGIDFVPFARLNLNITLGATVKSLREQINEFVSVIEKDIDLAKNIPESEAYKNEVLFEYKKTLDINGTLKLVAEREKYRREQEEIKRQQEAKIREQEELKRQQEAKIREQEELKRKEQENEDNQPLVSTLQAPTIEELPETYEMTFTVKGTIDQLKALKQYIVNNNIEIL